MPSPIWLKQAVHAAGAQATTKLRVERRLERLGEKFAIVRAIPLTGRTHQIRVHLASTGHAIVGDKIYGPDERWYLRFIETGWTAELEQALLSPRHALHASTLAIAGVGSWTSALPPDLAAFVDNPR
jgi:23S rRNA pseudouridine1911/1915/1917 synthase